MQNICILKCIALCWNIGSSVEWSEYCRIFAFQKYCTFRIMLCMILPIFQFCRIFAFCFKCIVMCWNIGNSDLFRLEFLNHRKLLWVTVAYFILFPPALPYHCLLYSTVAYYILFPTALPYHYLFWMTSFLSRPFCLGAKDVSMGTTSVAFAKIPWFIQERPLIRDSIKL